MQQNEEKISSPEENIIHRADAACLQCDTVFATPNNVRLNFCYNCGVALRSDLVSLPEKTRKERGRPPKGKKSDSKTNKGKRKGVSDTKNQIPNKWDKYRSRLHGLLSKYNQHRHYLFSYEDWDKIRPEQELQKARQKMKEARIAIFEVLKGVDGEMAGCRRWDHLAPDEDGQIDLEGVACSRCGKEESQDDNDIILCDFKDCFRAYHMRCVDPPLAPGDLDGHEGKDWFCPQCDCMMDCLETINEVLEADYDTFAEVLEKWGAGGAELDGEEEGGGGGAAAGGLAASLEGYDSAEDGVFDPNADSDEEDEGDKQEDGDADEGKSGESDDDGPLKMNKFIKNYDSAEEDGSNSNGDEVEQDGDLEDFDSDVSAIDAAELGALSDAGAISDDEEEEEEDGDGEEGGIAGGEEEEDAEEQRGQEQQVGKFVLMYAEGDEDNSYTIGKITAYDDAAEMDVVVEKRSASNGGKGPGEMTSDKSGLASVAQDKFSCGENTSEQQESWTIAFLQKGGGAAAGARRRVGREELEALRLNYKEYRREKRMEQLEAARRALEEKGKLDESNILQGKRRRNNIDYHKLSMALFGDTQNDQIDDTADWDEKSPRGKRGKRSRRMDKSEDADDKTNTTNGKKRRGRPKKEETLSPEKKKKAANQSPGSSPHVPNQRHLSRNNPLPGWTKELSWRSQGAQAGKADVYYLPPKGKKLRSRPDLVRYFELHYGLLPPPKELMNVFDFKSSLCICKAKIWEADMVRCSLGAGGCNGLVHFKCVSAATSGSLGEVSNSQGASPTTGTMANEEGKASFTCLLCTKYETEIAPDLQQLLLGGERKMKKATGSFVTTTKSMVVSTKDEEANTDSKEKNPSTRFLI